MIYESDSSDGEIILEDLNIHSYKKWDKPHSGAHYLNLEFSDGFLHGENQNVRIISELPFPIHKPFEQKESHKDLIALPENNQQNWTRLISNNEIKSVKKQILKYNSDYVTLTRNMLNCYYEETRNLIYDFDYNPCYSRGLLDCLELNNKKYLIRPDCDNNLCFTNLEKSDLEPLKISLNDFEINKGIFGIEINSFPQAKLLTLLHESEINLLKIQNENRLIKCWTKTFKSNLLDAKLNKFNQSQLGLIGRNLDYTCYDIENNNKLFSWQNNKTGNNSALKLDFFDTNRIGVMNGNSLKIIDSRALNNYSSFDPKLEDFCNVFTNFKLIDDNLFYISTRHHLIRTDIRWLKDYEFCSHLMKSSPCYMDFSQNYLCLSNQNNEKVLFFGNPIGNLPITLPNMTNTLNELRLEKDNLLNHNLDERLGYSTAGIKLIELSENCPGIKVFSSNYFGEIFKQQLIESENEKEKIYNKMPIDILYDWVNELPKPVPKLHLTNVAEMSNVRFALNKCANESVLRKLENIEKHDQFLKDLKRKFQKKYLGEVGAGFAAIWDEDDEEKESDEELAPEVGAFDKVHSWIQSSTFME